MIITLDLMIAILSWTAIVAGGALCIIGAIGMLRLPDVYTRMHGASLIDTGGAGLILLGLAMQAGFGLITAKLGLIFAFMLFTGPISTHALAAAALHEGVKPDENVPRPGGESSKT